MSAAAPSRLCLYDADCGICTWCVQLGARLDRKQRIEFVPNLDEGRFPVGVDQALVQQTIVVTEAGEDGFKLRAAAVAALIAVLPGGAPLAWLLRLPGVRWLADRGYRWVARNRVRISAAFGLGVCKVPAANKAASQEVSSKKTEQG